MTFEQFAELINMPSVLVLIAVITSAITWAVMSLMDRRRS